MTFVLKTSKEGFELKIGIDSFLFLQIVIWFVIG